MYRIPEKQFRKPNSLELRYTLFLSVCKSPTQSHTFHRTEISWHFFTTFRFDSFHFILICASWALSCEFTLSKGKKLRGNVVFTTTAICILFRFTYAYMQITVHPPDFAGDKNIDFEFPNACLLGHPFYFGYQDFKS